MQNFQHWFTTLERPAPTLLYSLEPSGIGTGQVQSLYDYLCTLAHEHLLPPFRVLALVLDLVGEQRRQLCARQFNGRDCHGVSDLTDNLVQGLALATGRSDLRSLTLLPLRKLFAGEGLLSAKYRHCPRCFAEHVGTGAPYGRLLWRVACVDACPVHQIQLVENECGAAIDKILTHDQRKVLEGVCSACGAIGRGCRDHSIHNGTPEQLWRANEIQELIARQLEVERAGPGASKEFMRIYCSTGGRTIARVAKRAAMSWSSLHRFIYQPGARMALNGFLRIAAAEGLPLTGLLLGSGDQSGASISISVKRRDAYQRDTDWGEVRKSLVEGTRDGKTLRRIAVEAKVHVRTLRKRFPDECAAVGQQTLDRELQRRNDEHAARLSDVEIVIDGLLTRCDALTLRTAKEITGDEWYPNAPRSQVFLCVRSILKGRTYYSKHPWSAPLRMAVGALAKRVAEKHGLEKLRSTRARPAIHFGSDAMEDMRFASVRSDRLLQERRV